MRTPIGKRPKNLEVSKRPRNKDEQIEADALHDILQLIAHHAKCPNLQQLTIKLWYDLAEAFARSVEGNPKATEEVRTIVSRYRQHVKPLDVEPILERLVKASV